MARPFIARDRTTWGSFSKPDSFTKDGLVTLKPRERTDAFSSKLSEYGIDVIDFFKRLYHGKPKDGASTVTEGYHDSTVSKITYWLTSFIASTIPVIAIIALVSISSLKLRLAAIAGFNGLVSLCLVWFTEARRTDVFSITAAYVTRSVLHANRTLTFDSFAAIQVVFVGQALDNGPQEVVLAQGGTSMNRVCKT